MTRSATALLSLSLALGGALVPASAAQAAPYCGIRWGSTPEVVTTGGPHAEVVDVRTGRHRCFDRLVLDLEGDVAGYFVRYVDQVRHDGSGARVPLAGGARLEVVVTSPTTPTDAIFVGRGSDVAVVDGYRTFRQVAWAGQFEGQSTFGLGVRARLPFRVLLLDGPGDSSRMVVDVAHRW